jgi:2-C-methyl-D-erythritol 2,4-cyclodiphosphate synthase
MRTGFGLDVHALGGDPPLLLCGVIADESRGLIGTSDADVAAHALCDALLGAAVLGDIGTHFPSGTDDFADADSMDLLARVVEMVAAEGLTVVHVDLTIVAQTVRVAPHRSAMITNISAVLGADPSVVSVKATTTDGLGVIGRDEGIAAMAVATLRSNRD